MSSDVASQRAFLGGSALIFAGGTTVTILWCESMAEMSGMPMPGGWTMSMTWMRMPGQAWSDAAASFLGMWMVMTVTMMLPSLMPMLWRYRHALAAQAEHLGRPTLMAGLGYFLVWSVIGTVVFPLGVALATLEMQEPALARAVPTVTGVVIVLLGALQFTSWKARHLAACREGSACCTVPAGAKTITAGSAWRHGLRLGLQCSACCANLMAIPLVIGVMDLRAMAIATAAITVERLAPAGQRVARAVGAATVGAGLALVVAARIF